MKRGLLGIFALLAIASFAIGRPGPPASTADLASAQAAVRRADAGWVAAASAASVDAWMAFYSPDAVVLLPNGRLAGGRERVRGAVTGFLALPHLAIVRHPIKVEIAATGDLAYSVGTYELSFGDSRDAPVPGRGTLLAIWRKDADGTWRCILDAWNPDMPAAETPPAAVAPAEQAAANPPGGPATSSPSAKYGEMPVHYEEAIRQYFQAHLNDPDSVRYRQISKPEQGYTTAITGVILMRETRRYGWIVKASVDAKGSDGRYAGFKSYTFLFRGEKIVDTRLPLFDTGGH